MNLAQPPRDDAKLQAQLERALRTGGGTHSLGDVGRDIKEGRAQWWCNGDAAIVTQVFAHPRRLVLNYWLVAGELAAALAMQDGIEAWAAGRGCDAATATGRRGWAPALARCGWRAHAVEYAKLLPIEGVGR